jgi:outer membrane receptor protein involved in Fe transport
MSLKQEHITLRKNRLAVAVASAALVLVNANVQAQSADDLEASQIEQIMVTGSRVARDGYDMPTPVSVLSGEDIQAEAPGSVAEFAMSLPSIQGSSTATSSSGSLSSGRAGIAALNLRGLGTGRTLVLLDGQRSVVSSAAGQVDTNTFPQSLVERVEVVSGGASSAYGSDAIAGVVNFILDKDYVGFKTSIEGGLVPEYDVGDQKYVITAGSELAGGRGHIIFSAEYYDQEGIHYTAPDWAKNGHVGIVNPDKSEGAPYFYVGDGIGISSYTPGGLIVSGPLQGTYFGEGGSVNQLNYGDVSGQWMVGGDWQYSTSGMLGTNSLRADDTRKSVFSRASFDVADNLEVFAQGSYASYEGYSHYINPTDRNRTIYIDNPYLPDEIVSAMQAEGIDTFTMSTSNADMPASGSNNKRATSRFVAGASGMFALGDYDIGFDAYYQLGITETDEHQWPTFNFAALADATDAVLDPVSGEIVCRSTLEDSGNGCVPINRFGTGVSSQESLDYVLGRPRREQELQQEVMAVNFTVDEIEAWAGPIGLAFGAEYREESIDGFVDSKYISGWKYGNYKVTEGKYDVKEAYIEALVPLMANLELNTAGRYTDYSTSGGVKTWKVGLVYQPFEDLTVRLTESTDIRAPNLSELFDAGTARTNAVSINGQSTPFIQNLQGTPTVGPEEAEATGLGLVYQPSFVPGLALSVDYYDVEVDGVIDFIGAQDVADACLIFGVTRYCDNLRYDENGTLQYIDLEFENLNSLISEGYDVEASYSMAMADLFPSTSGDLTFRYMGTHYVENTEDDGVTQRNRAGDNTSSTPDWVHRFTVRYTLDTWMVNLTGRGHSDGVIDNRYIECASNCPAYSAPNYTINNNSVDGEFFYDLYVSKSFATTGSNEAEFFVSMKNIFDTDPVLYALPANQGSENRPAYLPVNRGLMDVYGRNFRMGVRYEF